MAKDIPYDQKYYDPEIECMPRPELEALQLERLKDIESLDDIAKFPFCDKKT